MKKVALALTLAAVPTIAMATPSTVIWTPATTYIQPFLVPHLTYDTYFNAARGYPVDTGIEIGILPFDKLQAEVGFDVLAPAGPEQLYLNGKLGTPENALFDGMPGITAGIYNMGIQAEDKKAGIAGNQYNIIHAEVGKTLPYVGTLAVGYYTGKAALLQGPPDSKGVTEDANSGFMVSWYRGLGEITDKLGVGVDYQSGESAAGALGAGITVFPTPAAGIILGYVLFNEATGSGSTETKDMYTVQADVDLDFKAWFAKAEEPAGSAEAAPVPAAPAAPAAPAPAAPAPAAPAPAAEPAAPAAPAAP